MKLDGKAVLPTHGNMESAREKFGAGGFRLI
jgi:hypothetical protein